MTTLHRVSATEHALPATAPEGVERGPNSAVPLGLRSRPWMRETLWCLLSAVLAVALAAVSLRVWRAYLHVPFSPSVGDTAATLAAVKDIVDHGWFITNSDLGAPFGQVNYDFSTTFGDFWNLVIVRIGAIFTNDPALLMNAVYLAGFGLTAASCHAVLRVLRFSVPVAITGALVFALLPFHFLRSESHLFLTVYWGIPLGGLLVLGVLGHVSLFERRSGARLRGWLTAPTVRTVLIALVIGGASVYFAVFTLMLLAAATVSAAAMRRGRSAVLSGVALMGLVIGAIVLYVSPSIVYAQIHGHNAVVGIRSPGESLIYGLSGIQMLLPPGNHRIDWLGGAMRTFGATSPLQSEGSSPYIGLLLGAAFVVGVGRLVLGRRRNGRDLVADSSMMALVAFLLGTVGGLSALIAYLLTPQVRGWNRISVTLAFFAVVILAVGLERGRAALAKRKGRRGTLLVWSAAALAVAFAYWDQSPVGAPDYQLSRDQWRVSGREVRALEAAVPPNTNVLQLPYVPFPETPPVYGMADYDHLRAYVQSDDLRFSYGAMKGRPEDFLAGAGELSTTELVKAAAVSGFGAVWVDRAGYPDQGAKVEQAISALVGGAPPIVSSDARFAAYPIPRVAEQVPAAQRPKVKQDLLHPVTVSISSGFNAGWIGGRAVMKFAVQDGGARNVQVTMVLANAALPVTFTLPDGDRVSGLPNKNGNRVTIRLRVRDGDEIVATNDNPNQAVAGDARDLRVQVPEIGVTTPALDSLDSSRRPG